MNESEDFADVEIFVRPANQYKHGQDEQVIEFSYQNMSRRSNHSILKAADTLLSLERPGEYKIGVRDRGDEQYFQRFSVIEPHVEERGDMLIKNHLSGVLRHWRD